MGGVKKRRCKGLSKCIWVDVSTLEQTDRSFVCATCEKRKSAAFGQDAWVA